MNRQFHPAPTFFDMGDRFILVGLLGFRKPRPGKSAKNSTPTPVGFPSLHPHARGAYRGLRSCCCGVAVLNFEKPAGQEILKFTVQIRSVT